MPRAVVRLPAALADVTGGRRSLDVAADGADLRAVLDALAVEHPVLGRRLRDETGALRRYVNVYVDGADVRGGAGLATTVAEGATIDVLPSVAGG